MANHRQFRACYESWMTQQQVDLDDLQHALTNFPTDDDYVQLIIKKTISHCEAYQVCRAQLAKHDGPSFLAPPWGTTFENSCLWIGDYRPSLIIRLVYVLCGSQQSAHLVEFLQGVKSGFMGDLSSSQLRSIDALHAKTVKDEDKLTSIYASLQERIADEPLAMLAYNCGKVGESSQSEVVDEVMDTQALDMYKILTEADRLRCDILKRMLDILTPLQAAEFLIAAKKLQLCLHEWSKRRDIQMGITQLNTTSSSSD